MDGIQPLLDHVGATVEWDTGLPYHESKRDAVFYCDGSSSSFVARVKISEFAVDIYCDGVTNYVDRTSGDNLRCGADFIKAGWDTDEKLTEASESGDLHHINNSWFDLYCEGEHLDAVSHDVWDALRDAITFLQTEKQNAKAIENIGVDF